MNVMKKMMLLFLVFLFGVNSYSQETTKKDWYEDYDQFLNIVENINPQLEVRKLVTGKDILKELKNDRAKIDSLNNLKEFYFLFSNVLKKLNDAHAGICYSKDHFRFSNFSDEVIEESLNGIRKCGFTQEDIYGKNYFPLYLDYLNGEYVLGFDFRTFNKDNLSDSLLLPLGSIIKTINGKDVEPYLEASPVYLRWDNKLKKQYGQVKGYLEEVRIDKPVVITYLDSENNFQKFIYDSSQYSYSITSPEYLFYGQSSGRVEYFRQDSVLYIRTPKMKDREFYVSEILKKSKGNPIKKVIWDIRRNPGGSDEVWEAILSTLLKDTLTYDIKIASLDTDLANRLLKINEYGESTKLPFLEGKYKVVNWGSSKIAPSGNSIGFSGPIYVLQDGLIYSSAGSVSALARLSDQLTTVGTTTGSLLGNGITPIVFQLKNTKFAFQLEPVIDVTNIHEPYDYYHDYVEIPVELSREDAIRYLRASEEELYSDDFLFNHDPVFKKALNQ